MINAIFYYALIIICLTSTQETLSNITYLSCSDIVVLHKNRDHTNNTASSSYYYGLVKFRAKSSNFLRFSVTVDTSDKNIIESKESVEYLEDGEVNEVGKRAFKYKVIFSPSVTPPIVTAVHFNGEKICSSPSADTPHTTRKLYNISKRITLRQKRRAQYSDNPFLNGQIIQHPADKYASNPFISGHIKVPTNVENNSPNLNPSNPWLQSVGNTDINYPSVSIPARVPVYTPSTTPSTTPAPTTTVAPITYPCGRSKITNNQLIIRGETTRKGEWPWAVGIFKKKLGSLTFQCGGTLISSEIVVTAGHCVVSSGGQVLEPQNISVIIGLYDIQEWQTDDSKVKNVGEIILHPSFESGTSKLKNDIALLRFQYVITSFSNNIIPACLWSESFRTDSIYGNFGTVIGWGRDETGLFTTPTPRLTRQKVVSLEECQDSNPNLVPLTSSRTLCAGNRNGTGPCNGDSGSGMYFYINGRESWYLRAIVSTSISLPEAPYACNLEDYVIYTDVAKYLTWIKYYMT